MPLLAACPRRVALGPSPRSAQHPIRCHCGMRRRRLRLSAQGHLGVGGGGGGDERSETLWAVATRPLCPLQRTPARSGLSALVQEPLLADTHRTQSSIIVETIVLLCSRDRKCARGGERTIGSRSWLTAPLRVVPSSPPRRASQPASTHLCDSCTVLSPTTVPAAPLSALLCRGRLNDWLRALCWYPPRPRCALSSSSSSSHAYAARPHSRRTAAAQPRRSAAAQRRRRRPQQPLRRVRWMPPPPLLSRRLLTPFCHRLNPLCCHPLMRRLPRRLHHPLLPPTPRPLPLPRRRLLQRLSHQPLLMDPPDRPHGTHRILVAIRRLVFRISPLRSCAATRRGLHDTLTRPWRPDRLCS